MQNPLLNPPANPLDPDWCNKVDAFINWLYQTSGRTCGTYTGLYKAYLETQKEQAPQELEGAA
jgi:hypothetical protein